jgi:hypothetical protein
MDAQHDEELARAALQRSRRMVGARARRLLLLEPTVFISTITVE